MVKKTLSPAWDEELRILREWQKKEEKKNRV